MEVFTELVKILSEDVDLFDHKGRFMDSLEIPRTTVDPYVKLFDMGHCRAYDLIGIMLSEWIAIKKDSATVAELRRILRQDGFALLSDKLQKLQEMHLRPIKLPELTTSRRNDPFGISIQPHSQGNDGPPLLQTDKLFPITFGLKSVVQNFTGREDELRRLNEYFHSGECSVVLVNGLGGIGKTELTRKFTRDISNPAGNGQVVKTWLSGETPDSLLNSINQFYQQLHLPLKGSDGKPLGVEEMIVNIIGKLKPTAEFSRWLVVIANVAEIHDVFERALTALLKFSSDVFIILPSRRRDIYAGEVLELSELRLEDSVKFVKNSLRITDKSEERAIPVFCNQLSNFPVALNQAVAYIKQQQRTTLKGKAYGIQDYLDELAETDKPEKNPPRYTVWHQIFDKIRKSHGQVGAFALGLLDVLAFLNPDNIQSCKLHKLFKRFYATDEIDINQVSAALTILSQYSLISSNDGLISIHRLVQSILLEIMLSKSVQFQNKINPVKIVMLKTFWASFDRHEWKTDDMPHILTIWNHSSSHHELDELRAARSLPVAQQLLDLQLVNESYDFATKASRLLVDLYGPKYREYLLMRHILAAAPQQGQYTFSQNLLGAESHDGELQQEMESYFQHAQSLSKCPIEDSWMRHLTLVEFLGGGSFGGVYKAHNNLNKQPSAVKITYLQKNVSNDSDIPEDNDVIRFKMHREFLLLAGKQHTNIVNVYDGLETKLDYSCVKSILSRVTNWTDRDAKKFKSNLKYWASDAGLNAFLIHMEFCGRSLRQWITKCAKPPQDLPVHQKTIIDNILKGLQFLHLNKIFHRDLKSENIVFPVGDSNYSVKIADFGLSRIIHSNESRSSEQTFNPVTTRMYKAPELDSGNEYTLQADLYSLGMLICEVIKMLKPEDRAVQFSRIRYERTCNLPKVPFENAAEVILQLTEADPKNRLKTAWEINLKTSV